VAIVVPRGEGVETSAIHTSYSMAAGTAYVKFDSVKVPYENTLGPDNGGLQVILGNFNYERSVLRIRVVFVLLISPLGGV
jgi:alkylation response protein AidB-like acyl-CoA dehydrogenase